MSLEPLKRCGRGSLLLLIYSQAASADLLVYSLVITKVGEGLPNVEAKKESNLWQWSGTGHRLLVAVEKGTVRDQVVREEGLYSKRVNIVSGLGRIPSC